MLDYLRRVLRWAVVDLGIDGFRVDHALALTHQDLEAVWRLYDDANFGTEFVGTGNHDEVRGSQFFPHDLLAYGNAVMTMELFGGPMTMLAGDEYAEAERLRFKARGGVPTLWQLRQGTLPAANANLASWIARAGLLRMNHPALRGRGRERLHPQEGGGRTLLAAARFVDDVATVPLLVFNNLSRHEWTTGRYDIGARMRAWLDVTAFYQVRDLVGDLDRPDRLREHCRHAAAGAATDGPAGRGAKYGVHH